MDGGGLIGLAVQRAYISWLYPETRKLHGSIQAAKSAGRLDAIEEKASGPLAFHRTSAELTQFARTLVGDTPAPLGVTILYQGPMLWTNVTSTEKGAKVTVHAAAQASGTVLLVTERPVVRALVSGRISGVDAVELGLVTLHAPAGQVDMLKAAIHSKFPGSDTQVSELAGE
jgi:hypothetical protein